MRPRFDELQVERIPFMRFLQLCFHQKRKTLANNLKGTHAAMNHASSVQAVIEEAGLDPAIRAEAVSLEAMAQPLPQA